MYKPRDDAEAQLLWWMSRIEPTPPPYYKMRKKTPSLKRLLHEGYIVERKETEKEAPVVLSSEPERQHNVGRD